MRRNAAPFGGGARQNQINDHTTVTASANVLWRSQGNGELRYQ